jgi:hypothetical protein
VSLCFAFNTGERKKAKIKEEQLLNCVITKHGMCQFKSIKQQITRCIIAQPQKDPVPTEKGKEIAPIA